MEPFEFVESLRQRVIENDFGYYKEVLNGNGNAVDPTWVGALAVYKNLNEEQQDMFLNLLRLVQVNATSHILGIIDGSTYLNESRESFTLSTESGDLLSGDLQDLFLALEED